MQQEAGFNMNKGMDFENNVEGKINKFSDLQNNLLFLLS